MIDIISAQRDESLEEFLRLSQEYVGWFIAEIGMRYPTFDLSEFTSEHEYDDLRKKFPGEHIPPYGCLLIAKQDDAVCGCIALGKLTDDICEVRTLYVRPTCRGMGIGKQLAEAVLGEARKFGYSRVRLDTLAFMASAQNLYRSMGFYDIKPYRDMSAGLKQYIHFMELKLSN